MVNKGIIAGFIVSIFWGSVTLAGELTGYVALEGRTFFEEPQLSIQDDQHTASLVLEPEYYHEFSGGDDVLTLRPFLRYDPADPQRNHFDLRQADWLHVVDNLEFRFGVSKVFWGVVETKHLVDVINQTDAVEDVDGEDKLGQPTVQVAYSHNLGTLRLFYLPYFRERTFLGQESRLRGLMPVDSSLTGYRANLKEWAPNGAVRYEGVWGDWDVGFAHFMGTSRDPRFLQNANADSALVLTPFYDRMQQTSADIQYTTDAWLWKFEALTQNNSNERFAAVSAGVEYTFYGVFDSAMDIGVLAEYHRDDRGAGSAATLLDDDWSVGFRWVWNDEAGTEVLAGSMVDRNTQVSSYFAEASSRLNDHWKLEMDVRLYESISQSDAEIGFDKDSHLKLKISRFF